MHSSGVNPGAKSLDIPVSRYKSIFFDLDHTLWDYECNSRETLAELHTAFGLLKRGIQLDEFHTHFKTINFHLWQMYDRGLADHRTIREERFKQVLGRFNVYDEQLSEELSFEYLYGCPKKCNLVPHAKEMLDYLAGKYSLTIVTNGFDEIQSIKLMSGNITHYFDHVVTSQKAGYKKPDRGIFDYALAASNVGCHEVIMIGDNLLTDIAGARNAAIDCVFYNPDAIAHSDKVNHEIRCLSELKQIL
jgi:putative hydrolase of the HAD superfamily